MKATQQPAETIVFYTFHQPHYLKRHFVCCLFLLLILNVLGFVCFFQETTLYSKKKPAPHDKPGLSFLLSEDRLETIKMRRI